MSAGNETPIYENFNQINNDFTGTRNVQDTLEVVQYRDDTSHRVWLNDQNTGYELHWHSALEIIVPVESYYDVIAANTKYHLNPGDIIFIPPGELHEILPPSSGKRFIFMMNISLISRLKGYVGIQTLMSHPLLITKELYPEIYNDIYQLLVQIRIEYFQDSEYAELIIQSKMLEILIKIGENHINSNDLFVDVRPYKQKEYVQKFNHTLEYIDSHYMEDISLESIAAMSGFSKFHFSRLFKQYTDYTFCDYLCFRRIKAAEELLTIPDFSITDVAMQAGFSSISTFNRLFKQQKGCTPSEYRMRNRPSPPAKNYNVIKLTKT